MIRPQPMIVVADVEATSRWFQQVLAVTSGHGGPDYEMLMDGDDLVVQLHRWEADEHPHLGDPAEPSRGNGILLWFATDDFDAVVQRTEEAGVVVLDVPRGNPNSGQREIWLRGPEGYVVVTSGP